MQHVTVTQDSSNEPSIIIPEMGVPLQASMLAGFTGSEAIVQRANNNLMELGKRLLTSAELGDTDEVRQLMSRGAPFATDWLGTSPLHAAAANGHLETCELLLRAGISRDARTKVDRTPLHVAAQEGHADIVELLLDTGADVDAKDMLRMTPLHWAVEREHVECVRLLLQHGASPHHVSKFDKTAFSMALEANRHDILELLEASVTAAATASATLEATESLALVLGQVPVPAHQEEVQTSSQKVHPEEPNPPKLFVQEPAKVTEQVTEDKVPEVKVEETVVDTGSQSTLRLLQAHGIHMLPTEEQTLVASAIQSGQTVVLTEAGKLALNLTGAVQTDGKAGTAGVPQGRKKVITIRATPSSPLQQRLFRSSVEKRTSPEQPQQPRAPVAYLPRRGRPPGSAITAVGYAPNILKRVAAPVVVSSAASTVGVAVVSPTVVTASSSSPSPRPPATKVLVRSPPTTKVMVNGSGSKVQLTDLATITRQLEEARREAEAYKLLLSKKEREAELYRQQLQSITQQSQ